MQVLGTHELTLVSGGDRWGDGKDGKNHETPKKEGIGDEIAIDVANCVGAASGMDGGGAISCAAALIKITRKITVDKF